MGMFRTVVSNRELLQRGKSCIRKLDSQSRLPLTKSVQIVNVAYELGYWCGLGTVELEKLEVVAHLHHIGYLDLPPTLFTTQGILPVDDRKTLRNHVSTSDIHLRVITIDDDILAGVRQHHERWDGTGYPLGLKGEEISVYARITAIADSYVAMTSGRGYRKALDNADAIKRLKAESGKYFDPMILDLFISILEVSPEIITRRLYTK